MVAKGGGETSHPRESVNGIMPLKDLCPGWPQGDRIKCGGCSGTSSGKGRVKTEEKEKRQMKTLQSKPDVSPYIHFVSMRKRGSRVPGGDDVCLDFISS